MIIIPEIETVVILVPRTGTTSLIKAIKERYPEAMRLYRHMEADGIPSGYDAWAKVGVVRDPVERLWSLYKYLQTFDGPYPAEYIAEQRESVNRPFSDWILNNETPFTHPYDSSGNGKFYPKYMIRHNLPENRKSQRIYLRPDLGTEVYRFNNLSVLATRLDVILPHDNQSAPLDWSPDLLTQEALEYICRAFAWDIGFTKGDWWINAMLTRAKKNMGQHEDA